MGHWYSGLSPLGLWTGLIEAVGRKAKQKPSAGQPDRYRSTHTHTHMLTLAPNQRETEREIKWLSTLYSTLKTGPVRFLFTRNSYHSLSQMDLNSERNIAQAKFIEWNFTDNRSTSQISKSVDINGWMSLNK